MDEEQRRPRREHPVITGLIAMGLVTAVVGAVFGGGAYVASRAAGLSEDSGSTDSSTVKETLYLPPLTLTESSSATNPISTDEPTRTQRPPEVEESTGVTPISLSALQTEVGAMEPIDLTGVYPGGEGAILQVQQFTAGVWDDFPVTILVSGSSFSTYIQTGQTGVNRFRVVDTELDQISNEVTVTVG